MDKTLGYLRETLSNYANEHSQGKQLYRKLEEGHFSSEEAFVQHLNSKEVDFLNQILPKEINYAKQEQDKKRARQLNEVYELLI
jgi:hypothetical protein